MGIAMLGWECRPTVIAAVLASPLTRCTMRVQVSLIQEGSGAGRVFAARERAVNWGEAADVVSQVVHMHQVRAAS
jgi:hypothetical protein